MGVIGSCGHDITHEETEDGWGTQISVKENDGVSYIVVCKECLLWYQKKRLILKTQKSIDIWLKKTTRPIDYFECEM